MKTNENFYRKLVDVRNKGGVYKIDINGSFYVGSAINLSKRLRCHINSLQKNKHRNIHLQKAYNKYMKIDFDIIEFVDDVNMLISVEQKYINELNPRYNISKIAGSQLGFRHSDKTKNLLSIMQVGKKIPEDVKRRMSEAKKGAILSEEHRKNISISKMGSKNPFYCAGVNHPQYGKPKSAETKKRISITSRLRGCHKGENNKASKSGVLYDVITGANYIFYSLKPLCEKLGLNYKGVISALRKKRFYNDRYYIDYVYIPKDRGYNNGYNQAKKDFGGIEDE